MHHLHWKHCSSTENSRMWFSWKQASGLTFDQMDLEPAGQNCCFFLWIENYFSSSLLNNRSCFVCEQTGVKGTWAGGWFDLYSVWMQPFIYLNGFDPFTSVEGKSKDSPNPFCSVRLCFQIDHKLGLLTQSICSWDGISPKELCHHSCNGLTQLERFTGKALF